MNRRTLMIAAASAAALSRSGSALSADMPQIVIRLGVTASPASPYGAAAKAFARFATAMTAGRVRVEFFPSSELGGEKEMAEDIIAGGLDMAFVSTSVLAPYAPLCGLFDIPFLFKTATQARGFLDSPPGQQILARLDDANLSALAWGENGVRHITTFERPVRSPADLKGLTIRVPQSDIMLQAFEAFGAKARPVSDPELYAALSSGVCDGQDNPIGSILDARLFECQHVLSVTSHIYAPAVFLASNAVMLRVSAPDRGAIRAAAVRAGQVSRDAAQGLATSGLDTLRQNGMTIVEDVDHAAFIAAGAGLETGLVQRFGKAQLDAIRSFAI